MAILLSSFVFCKIKRVQHTIKWATWRSNIYSVR